MEASAKSIDGVSLSRTLRLAPLETVARGAGERVEALGTAFDWKVKGRQTGFAFAVYEMALPPGVGVPLHAHPFAEFFYVLAGRLDVAAVDGRGSRVWQRLEAGESVNVPSGTPHGFMNRTEAPATFLSVANHQHEALFNDYVAAVAALDSPTEKEMAEIFTDLAARHQGYLVDAPPADHA